MDVNRPFICDVCARIFTRNENLERHKRSKHQDGPVRPFECSQCQSKFSRKDVCKRHEERCRGQRSRRSTSAATRTQPANAFDDEAQSSADMQSAQMMDTLPSATSDSMNRVSNPGDPWPQPSLQALPAAFGELRRNAETYVSAYRDYFHHSLPLLHPSAVSTRSPPLLLNIIIAIGCFYRANTLTGQDAVFCIELSRSLFETGYKEIQSLSKRTWDNFQRTPWVMQAWLLHIVYGAYVGDAARYQLSKELLRELIDCVQRLGLLKQSTTYPAPRPWLQALAGPDPLNQTYLQSSWNMYIEEESLKLCMHTLMLLDFHVLSPCNLRPQTSAMEFEWGLPFSSALWEAESADAWLNILSEDARIRAQAESDENFCHEDPSAMSLIIIAQSLMTDAPSAQLLSSLESSPISIIFLLTSIDALVRDLTRSLYQLPPNLADPSAFHILSQNQNRQLVAALKHISRLVEEQPESVRCGSAQPLWISVERMCVAIKVALCRPDDLLITGLVDNSITGALAAATRLALGCSTGSRRSLQSLLQYSSGDDAMLLLLEETVEALHSILSSGQEAAKREPPWITVLSYRILLAMWRSMRWGAAEMRARAHSGTQSRFDTPTVIFNSVIGVVSDTIGMGSIREEMPSPASVSGEVCFSQAILRFWTDRSVWAMGTSMVHILEEIISVTGLNEV